MRKLTHEEVGKKRITLDETKKIKRHPVYALADNIRSIYNVGSIFRTSDAALIEKLYLTGYTPYPPRQEIEKVALGATEAVPWEYIKDPMEAVKKIKEQGIKIVPLEITQNSRNYTEIEASEFPLCLILGNELTGVSNDIIELSDFSIEIPQFGFKHSINVSVAYGVAVMELVRSFKKSS
ncbi:MAG TPA: RNA methyltransferase [Ignavibacteria bacterium]|nr:RNA methyltransferase [Ignavibacteria bacterium]HMQ99679.1 RNA methyltransferase [Ignavibacteria bacterium]